MRRGILLRVGRRRAVYLVRDPLIRIVFTRIYGRGDDWHYAGFHYLLKKLFEGIKGIYGIATLDGEIYIGEPIKFQLLNQFSFRMMDKDKVKYFVTLGYNIRKISLLAKKYDRDKKIIIFHDSPDARIRRSLRKEGFSILTLQNIEYMARDVGFRRVI
jgi:hypothetical protein